MPSEKENATEKDNVDGTKARATGKEAAKVTKDRLRANRGTRLAIMAKAIASCAMNQVIGVMNAFRREK